MICTNSQQKNTRKNKLIKQVDTLHKVFPKFLLCLIGILTLLNIIKFTLDINIIVYLPLLYVVRTNVMKLSFHVCVYILGHEAKYTSFIVRILLTKV
jgi:hypothetical protein